MAPDNAAAAEAWMAFTQCPHSRSLNRLLQQQESKLHVLRTLFQFSLAATHCETRCCGSKHRPFQVQGPLCAGKQSTR